MSAESLAIALHHSRARGTAKIVLLGIANHDGDGGAWPSTQTLAKYANVAPRNVQRALDQLVSLGEVRRVTNGGGRANTPDYLRPNLYHVLLECPPHCDGSRQHRDTRKSAHYVPRFVDIETTADPLAESSPPDASVTRPLADSSPDPLAPASPELHLEQPQNTSRSYDVSVRARVEHMEPSGPTSEPPYVAPPRCPARPTRAHAFRASTHSCIDCGAPDPQHTDTKEAMEVYA